MKKEIARDFYLEQLIRRENNGLVKLVTGIRRAGKSYLLNELFYRHLVESGVPEDHIIRFGFDSADDLALIGEDLLSNSAKNAPVDPNRFMSYIRSRTYDDGMFYLLLDEVQLLGSFEAVLNGYLRNKNLDVYATGSNAKFLSKDIITEFAGRGDRVHMYPLSFSEFMSVYEGDRAQGLLEYMRYGGIPVVVLRTDSRDKEQLLKELSSEVYVRDIVQRNHVRNEDHLQNLLNVLSSSIGSLTSLKRIADTFRSVMQVSITPETVRRHLDYVENAFLIQSADRFDVSGRSYIGSPRKYYFTDMGLRNAQINFRQFDLNYIMENVIYNELRMRGYNVDVGVVPVREESAEGKLTRKQLEIDFVCNMGSKRYYIQSAYAMPDEQKRLQEVRPLLKTGDFFKRIIITADPFLPTYDDNGILTIDLYDFLMEPDMINY